MMMRLCVACADGREVVMRVFGIVGILALAGCSAANLVGVESESAPWAPVFRVTDASGRGAVQWVYGLSVLTCGTDSAVWTIAAAGDAPAPTRIVYGEPPRGYVSRVGPEPLRPGCYDVYVSESKGARFRIGRDGRVAGGALVTVR